MRLIGMVALASGLAAGLPARAQTVDAVMAAQRAVVAANDKTPLTSNNAMFVTSKAPMWGAFDKRATTVFRPGEPLHFYLEPVGMKHKEDGGLITCGISLDVEVRQGDVIRYGRDNFIRADFPGHYGVAEVMLNGQLALLSFTPGDYTLKLVLRDHVSGETATVTLPFSYSEDKVDKADKG